MKPLFALCLVLLTACATPYRPPQFPDPHTSFPGLADVAAQAAPQQADVLLVHGICTHDADWAYRTIDALAAALDANTPARPTLRAAADGQVLIVPQTIATRAGSLHITALIWSPLTTPLKRQLCYDQTDKTALCQGEPPLTPQRAPLNAALKDRLVDDCLSDAVIYAGAAYNDIALRMREAILQALAPSAGDMPLIVIADSLGGKILFDTLLRMTDDGSDERAAGTARLAVARMRYLVMAANQLPLMGLANQGLALRKGAVMDSLQALLRQRRTGNRAAADRGLTLVAFTDPNDVLSYTLQTEKYAGEGIHATNILVSNAPTYWGLLERPDRAHLDCLTNPDVSRLIACGRPASAWCK